MTNNKRQLINDLYKKVNTRSKESNQQYWLVMESIIMGDINKLNKMGIRCSYNKGVLYVNFTDYETK
jgi:hypothetical protein